MGGPLFSAARQGPGAFLNDDDALSEPGDGGPRRELDPLRRKPKTLTAPPTLHGGGTPIVVDLGLPPDGGDGEAGGQGRLVTAQDGAGRGLEELLGDRVPDPEAARMVRRISRGLALHAGWRDADLVPGGGRARPAPYRHRSDDIDLDRTLERLVERPVPEETDVIVREPLRPSVDVVLMVDVSGSMRGEKVRTAAATVAALAGALGGPGGRHRLAVVGFWSDAAVLEPLGGGASPVVLLDRLLRIPARGLTNVQFGLATGDAVLRGSAARRRVGVLLTDAVHNAGPDPREVARRFGELHVLLEVDGEHDEPLGRDIARLGRGRTAVVRSHRDVGPALSRVLGRA